MKRHQLVEFIGGLIGGATIDLMRDVSWAIEHAYDGEITVHMMLFCHPSKFDFRLIP